MDQMKRLAVFTALVGVAACRSSVDTAFGSATGNYTLVRVDGTPVPFKNGTTVTVRGTIGLNGNGNFTLTQADSSTSGSVINTSLSGTWSLTDNALALIPSVGSLELGIVSLDTIRLGHASHDNIYVRH
jgi:hypothetical protein